MIDTVLFDIGNVFVRWDPRYLYQKLISDADELDYFLENVVNLAWHTHHDKGRTFREGREILAREYPQYIELIKAYDQRWPETIGDLIEGTVQILDQLTIEGVSSYALTNFSSEKWPHFERDYAFTQQFKGVVVSGEAGLVKPDPAIFELTVKKFGLTPNKTLFIDDRLENVEAAEAIGMVGHLFTSPEKLEVALKELDLL